MAPLPGSQAVEYRGKEVLIFTIAFLPPQIFCVALRFFVRYMKKIAWGLDDAVVLLALAGQIALAGVIIGAVKYAGLGYSAAYLQETDRALFLTLGKYLTAIRYLYPINASLPKLSILLLYHRLFPTRGYRLANYFAMALVVGTIFGSILISSVMCRPYAANWDYYIPGSYCIPRRALYTWGSFPNIMTDIIMLLLPMPVLWSLHTTRRLKIGLTFTFAMGSLGLVTSIFRFQAFFHQASPIDGLWPGAEIWTQVEPGVYLICACLITYKPLLEHIGCKNHRCSLTWTRLRQSGQSSQDDPSLRVPSVPLKRVGLQHIESGGSRAPVLLEER